jgi:hypothetical protein
VSDVPSRSGQTVTVAGLIVETGGGTAILDDGTGRVRLGGAGASDALSLLEPGDAVEVTGVVSNEAGEWLIAVDPDLIVTLAGTASDAPAAPGASAAGASPSSNGAADAAALTTPPGRSPIRGLALAASGVAQPSPVELIALVGAAALLVFVGGAALAVRAGRVRPRPLRRRLPRRGTPQDGRVASD